MSTGKRLGGKEAAAKGRFLNHLNFGYAKHIKVKEKPSEDALEQMLRTRMHWSRCCVQTFPRK